MATLPADVRLNTGVWLGQRPWLAVYGCVAVVLVAAVWPAWWMSDTLAISGDALIIHYPWFVLWRDALSVGEVPWWNPYTLGGLPSLPTLQSGYGYPVHWILTWLSAPQALNWSVGLHVVLAGLGAAWCAGRMGARDEGKVLAGLTYALGSALTARLWAGHLSFLEANAWLPIATGFATRAYRRRDVVGLALTIAIMTLAGQPELAIFAVWWIPVWALVGAAGGGTSGRGVRRAGLALLGAASGLGLGGALAAWLVLPTAALLSMSNRAQGMDWDFLTGASLPPWHLLGAFAPLIFGDPRAEQVVQYWPGPGYEWHERLLYVGVIPLVAATRVRGRWRWACWGGAVFAVALAFGRYVPWYAWAQPLPGYSTFRIPSKHLTLVALAMCLAAGLGLERMRGRQVAIALACVGVLGGLTSLSVPAWIGPVATVLGGGDLVADDIQVGGGALFAAVACLAGAGAALLPGAWAPRTLAVLAVLDVLLVLAPFRLQPSDPKSVAAPLADLDGFPRLAVVGNGAILGNFGPVARITQPAGYTSLFRSGYAALATGTPNPGVAVEIQRVDDPALGLLGYPAAVEVDRGRVVVFEPVPPRVWLARCARPGGAAEVRAADFPRLECVTVAQDHAPDPAQPAGEARLVSERAGALDVQAEGPGWLVTDQPFYPGWSVDVDGQPATLTVVDGALVGAQLPAGPHRARFRYMPAGLQPGLLVAAAASLVLLAVWRIDPRAVLRLRSALRTRSTPPVGTESSQRNRSA